MTDLNDVPATAPTSSETVDDGAPPEVVAPPMVEDEQDEYSRRLQGYEHTKPQYE